MKPHIFLKLLGQHIKDLRVERDISIRELAEMCSTSEPELVLLESGELNSSMSLIINIAAALDIELHDLFVWNT